MGFLSVKRFFKSPLVGAAGQLIGVAWEAALLLGAPVGIDAALRPQFLIYGLLFIIVSTGYAFFAFYKREGELKDEIAILEREISALKADPPVVLLEFSADTMFRPAVVEAINDANRGSPVAPSVPMTHLTVRSSRGSVLNVQIQPLRLGNGDIAVSFDPVLEVASTAIPVTLFCDYPIMVAGRKTTERQDSQVVVGGNLFSVLTSTQQGEWKTTDIRIDYVTPGRRYISEFAIEAQLDGYAHAKVRTRYKTARDVTPPLDLD